MFSSLFEIALITRFIHLSRPSNEPCNLKIHSTPPARVEQHMAPSIGSVPANHDGNGLRKIKHFPRAVIQQLTFVGHASIPRELVLNHCFAHDSLPYARRSIISANLPQ